MAWWGDGMWGAGNWQALAVMLASIWCLLVGASVWVVLAASNRQQLDRAQGHRRRGDTWSPSSEAAEERARTAGVPACTPPAAAHTEHTEYTGHTGHTGHLS